MASKVLIVDDMPDAIMMLSDMLIHEGYEVHTATRGQQALAIAEEIRPDVILLDVMMPGMNGIETCRRLRMNPTTAEVPVVLVSARTPSEARAEGLLAGAADYITKPVNMQDLLTRVSRLIDTTPHNPPEQLRLLEEMAYTTLTVLPCNLTWILSIDADNQWLVHEAIAMEDGAEAAYIFLSMIGGAPDAIQLPVQPDNNPLADVVLARQVLIDAPTTEFYELSGGRVFSEVFEYFEFEYISILPLVTAGETVGIMLLATIGHAVADSERAQQILNSLSSQASMVVKNARLLVDLAAREAQMRAEQAFRQMVMDTMGEGLIVVDEEAKIIYVNNRLLLMTGYTRDSLYGQSVGEIFHPDQRKQLLHSIIERERSTQPFDQKLYTRDQRSIPVLLSRATAPSSDMRGKNTVMVVSDLSELYEHEAALRQQTQRLAAINRASTAISSASTFHDVVKVSLEAAIEVVNGKAATLFTVDNATRTLHEVAAIGLPAESKIKRSVAWGNELAGWVAETSQSQLVTPANQDQTQQVLYERIYGITVGAIMAVPLVAFDEVIGVLEVVRATGEVFNEQDLATLESLAGSAAITIENARLFDESRRRVNELSTLLDASAAVTTTLDFGSILEQIAHRLSLALQVERVLIMDWHQEANGIEPLAEVANCYWEPGNGPLFMADERPLVRAVFETGTIHHATSTTPPTWEMNVSGLYTRAAFPIGDSNRILTLHGLQSQPPLALASVQLINGLIAEWLAAIRAYDADNWASRANLTDLAQRALQISEMRWCSILYWDETAHGFRLLREIGRVLWLDQTAHLWHTRDYPSLTRALASGEVYTLSINDLSADTNEHDYLRQVGGHTCLVAPLLSRGESKGLVTLIDSKPKPRHFDLEELSLCQGIANVVGNAMENAQLYTSQEQRASALEAAYEQLQEADQIKDQLLQNLSHELRTPLTHILGYLRLMTDQAFGTMDQEQTEVIELVATKSQQMADIIEDIVSVQNPTGEKLELRPIHLERSIALAVRAISPQAHANGVRIVPRIPTNLPLVQADPDRIEAVFKELLENAIKFSPRDSKIEITVEDLGGLMVRAGVRDEGIGISTPEQEKIFRQFYQVDSGTTRRVGGTGLGLAVVRQIIEGHNGRVWVESEPGQGSQFYLTLPKASAMETYS